FVSPAPRFARPSRAMRASSIPPASRGPQDALRVAFACAWIGTQAALVLTAGSRPDAVFGFLMFSESSTIAAHLTREVEAPSGHGTVPVAVKNGQWTARD